MKTVKLYLSLVLSAVLLSSCLDLTEHVYDKLDAGIYYQNEQSVQGAVAAMYNDVAYGFPEWFWYLQEFSADQVVWRIWNGGEWGYDEGEKYVLSTHTWSSESVIIKNAWNNTWKVIGLANQLLGDLEKIDANDLRMTDDKLQAYIAEVRTLRAWAYYSLFEIWGGALPLNDKVTADIPGSADPDFDKSCHKIYDFIVNELDETVEALPKETGDNATRNRMNQGVNRILKARLLLNAEVFIKEDHFTECESLCKQILAGDYGTYSIVSDYREVFDINNNRCSEVVFALALDATHLNATNTRNTPFYPYNYGDYFQGNYDGNSGWNCTCLAPSWDNSGNVQSWGGTDSPKSFLTDYGDKLGAVYERFDDQDVRKQNYVYDPATKQHTGIFLKGAMRADFGIGDALKADADREGQDLVYVDQVGTFLNQGRALENVMSPRWGETNSGVRLVKYPIYPVSTGIDYRDIDDVQFRLAEVVYMIAECEMRHGNPGVAKDYVDMVRSRYLPAAKLAEPGPGFTAFDMDWMLSEWGKEYLNEGNRRRTDLRRFDKFTQGQWWFFGRTADNVAFPAKRDRKYEWFPLPASALLVNPGLVQTPGY
ncbi:MAG: RagB/SusD family nutrient uptake outer membrane protein [Paludibacteraceae bacterium]|nr:RagB/SusD family nutrient uptake outer membrane protein [Paludibacteraceae bacterium]